MVMVSIYRWCCLFKARCHARECVSAIPSLPPLLPLSAQPVARRQLPGETLISGSSLEIGEGRVADFLEAERCGLEERRFVERLSNKILYRNKVGCQILQFSRFKFITHICLLVNFEHRSLAGKNFHLLWIFRLFSLTLFSSLVLHPSLPSLPPITPPHTSTGPSRYSTPSTPTYPTPNRGTWLCWDTSNRS